jgi:hypothetical protein
MVWNGSSWLRIGTGGGNLWLREWTIGLHKMRENLFQQQFLYWKRNLRTAAEVHSDFPNALYFLYIELVNIRCAPSLLLKDSKTDIRVSTFKTSFIYLKFSQSYFGERHMFCKLGCQEWMYWSCYISCNVFTSLMQNLKLFLQTDYACRFSKVFLWLAF